MLPPAVMCQACRAVWSDDPADGKPAIQLHPETVSVRAYITCPSCLAKAQQHGLKLMEEVREFNKRFGGGH